MKRLMVALAASLTIFGLVVASNATGPSTFDGAPSAPLPFDQTADYANYDVQIHSRDPVSWQTLPAISAEHGADCSAPPATHSNTTYEGSVFQCANHVMTAINGSAGYAEIVLTPNLLFDFSNGGTVTFDLSTLRMSGRDWVDVWITPYDQALVLPFDMGDVDLQGVPRTGIHIMMNQFNGETTFTCSRIDNFVETDTNSYWWNSIDYFLRQAGRAPSATVRDTFKLDLSPDSIHFYSSTIPGYEGCNTSGLGLNWSKGVVQFAHHSYTPTKDNSGVPATWHWDNLNVWPSTPFTIVHSLDRYTQGGTIQFEHPAPAGATLRFAAICAVKVNGQSVSPIPASGFTTGHKASYSVPVPEGATSAQIGLTGNWGGPCIAEGFTLWSLITGTPSPSATAPSSTATSTNTPVPTNTATPSPTSIPPTATPSPSRTPTPLPYRCVNSLGQTKPGWVPGGRC